MKISTSFLFLIIFISYLSLSISLLNPNPTSEILTPTELLAMPKVTDYILSPDGKYLIYGVKKWNPETGKSYTHFQYKNIETKEVKDLTEAIEGQTDSSPQISADFPDYIFFQRTNKDIKSSIFYIPFPPGENKETRLTEYLLPVNDFKIKSKSILFSTEMYFQCENMNCTKQLIDQESKQDYQVYTKLFMFHWDQWLVEGKGSHLFLQKINFDKDKNIFILDGEETDVTKKMEINTPPLFTDFSNYDINCDGTKIAFSAHIRNEYEAVKTGFKTYYYDLNLMDKPICITTHTEARTQNPVFSKDGTKIAYLAMTTPGLESEILHFEIYNILTGKTIIVPNEDELSIISFMWDNDHKIIFVANSYQENQIFTAELFNTSNPIINKYEVKYSGMSYSLPYIALKKSKRNCY